jgi:pilus assembly protein CpaB
MSDPNTSKQGSGSSFARVLAGAVLGFILGAFTMNVVGQKAAEPAPQKSAESQAMKLVPVVVAAKDIPEGTEVTFDHIQQRMAPDYVVTSSVVKPEGANYIVNARVLVPVQAGDMLLWSQFETKPGKTEPAAPLSDTKVQ